MSTQPSPFRPDERFWELHQSASNLTQYACMVSSRHIKDGVLRGQFNRDMAYHLRQILEDVRSGKTKTEDGLQAIKIDYQMLGLMALDLAKKGTGMVAGGFQVAAGGALCATAAGCVLGLPLALHGANNIYENGKNMSTGRDDAVGPVKVIYQKGAMLFGGTASHGNVAYGLGDIGFSIHGIFRKVVRPDTVKLFHYIGPDYVRAYSLMKTRALWFEVFSSSLVLEQIYRESQDE